MMNKRVLRKFAIPSSSPNPKNGIFCADQVKYVVRTAIKNIDHQRTLVLYIYAKESVLAGNHTPRWTMFQQKGGYITLCTDDKAHAGSSLCLRISERITFSGTNALSIPKPTRDGSRDIVSPKSKKDLTASACFSWIYCGKSKGKMN